MKFPDPKHWWQDLLLTFVATYVFVRFGLLLFIYGHKALTALVNSV